MIDLTDKFLSDDHQIRFGADMISFNYFAIDTSAQQPFALHESYPSLADLSFRGYTAEDDTNFLDHDYYDYSSVPSEMYGDQTGNFTKYGNVIPLVGATDNQYVIMHHGDHLDLDYDAQPVPEGQERSFILYNNALYKHAKHAWGKTVEPLPFSGMTKYPYDNSQESYPMTPENTAYLNTWNTRVISVENPNQGHSSTIIDSSSTATVTGVGENSRAIGGLVGGNSKDIINSFATGKVTGDIYIGGLIGNSQNSAYQISNSYASGDVEGNYYLGSLIGYANVAVQIEKSYASGNVVGINSSIGGLIGYSYQGEIEESFALGNVTGDSTIGGLVGNFEYGTVANAYTTGSVTATNGYIGGLFGGSYANTLTNVYSSGEVTGSGGGIGGLIGYDSDGEGGPSTISSAFWDTEASGQLSSAGGTGKTTEAMQTIATFTDLDTPGLEAAWDFSGFLNDDEGTEDIWALNEEINSGYPYFSWQYSPWFENLPGLGTPINLEEGQIVTTNPYVIRVYPQDDQGILKVDFYVDDNLICTVTDADESGIYSCAWDTSRYHSLVRVVAHDNNGNQSQALTRTAVVNLDSLPAILPVTGISLLFYLPISLLGIGIFMLIGKRRKIKPARS